MKLSTSIALLTALALAVATHVVQADPNEEAAWLDLSADEILERATVPSDEKPHGEVRLIRRGAALVVQTVLETKLLKRAVGKIVEKERKNWPETRTGHLDSESYTETLIVAREALAAENRERTDRTDRRRRMMIEFVLVGERAIVAIAEPVIDPGADSLRVIDRRELALLTPSYEYVRANMRLIAEDALGMTESAAASRIP